MKTKELISALKTRLKDNHEVSLALTQGYGEDYGTGELCVNLDDIKVVMRQHRKENPSCSTCALLKEKGE